MTAAYACSLPRLLWRLPAVLGRARRELGHWQRLAREIPERELRSQALASIRDKTFHSEGAALFAGRAWEGPDSLLATLVAYQTLADYLDNLCDRSLFSSPHTHRRLHQAMIDAVGLEPLAADYYTGVEAGGDAHYLPALVVTCQQGLRALPHYALVRERAVAIARLYVEMQVLKHGPLEQRERDLEAFFHAHRHLAPHLRWYEFAAAAGSTLALFHLFNVAARPTFDPMAAAPLRSYFAWICPLHILLDYLIDREEDRLGGDLNFVTYYRDEDDAYARLTYLVAGAEAALQGPEAGFHRMIIEGLLALYLSADKVAAQPPVESLAKRLLTGRSWRVPFFFFGCRLRHGWQSRLQPPPRRVLDAAQL
jgi:tetraprenyl-beta-curcumene synthase